MKKISSFSIGVFVILTCLVVLFQNCSGVSTKNNSNNGASGDPDFPGGPGGGNTIPSGSNVYYVRTDGGSTSQCNGRALNSYSGSGTGQSCAFKTVADGLSVLKTGEILYVESGTYSITTALKTLPSGVTLQGNCSTRPKLVGSNRVSQIFNLTNSSNTTIKCFDISDNAECIVGHNTQSGQQEMPCSGSNYAGIGIRASDSSNVLIDRVKIHGFADKGILAGRLSNWTIRDSNIDGNGWIGFDGDIGSSSNSGTITFLRSTIRWNGCVEMFNGTYQGCWAQQQGGYGDGLGTATTAGNWVFDQVVVEYNTSDGIDMLYVEGAGSVTVKNSWIAHNAGNQVKTNRNAVIENNVIVGDCAFHQQYGTMTSGDYCRAQGNTLSVGMGSGITATIKDNTITGEGDCLVLTGGGGTLIMNGNIFDGRKDFIGGDQTCLHYNDGGSVSSQITGNVVYNTKSGCPSGSVCSNPQFVNAVFETFNPALQSGSPATGYGANLSLVPSP